MHPTLIRIYGFPITTYGLMVAIAFASAGWLIVRRGRREGIPVDFLQDLMVWAMVASLVGARLLHVVVNFGYYLENPLDIIFSREGYVFYGGFLAGFATVVYRVHRQGQDIWKIGDLIAPYLAMAHGIGRIGCFLFGCCYGAVTSVPWAVRFPRVIDPGSGMIEGSPAYLHHLSEGWVTAHAAHSLPVHPSQLYSSALLWLNFGFLLYLRRRGHRKGDLLLTYVTVYAVGRFIVEFTRGDHRGELLGSLSTQQVIAVLLFVGGLIGMIWRHRTQTSQSAAAATS